MVKLIWEFVSVMVVVVVEVMNWFKFVVKLLVVEVKDKKIGEIFCKCCVVYWVIFDGFFVW